MRCESEEVLGHLRHDGALVRLLDVDVLDIEQARDAEPLGHAERQLEVGLGVVLVQRVVVDQVRLMLVDQRAEGHAVLPVRGEVGDGRRVHVAVASRLLARPQQQALLARSVLVADSLRSDSKKSEKQRKYTKITKKIVRNGPFGLGGHPLPAIRVFCLSAAAHLDGVVQNDSPEHSENHLEIVVDEVGRL